MSGHGSRCPCVECRRRRNTAARAMNATARATWLAGEPTVPVQLDLLTHLEGALYV